MIDTEDPPKTIADIQRNSPELYQRILLYFKELGEAQAKGDLTEEDIKKVD